ncbi:MAG: DUF624 domain-containing protein [Kurthia sp.]|nr:DUF624 domain-containing protein [Candidatus Kurthia equi]
MFHDVFSKLFVICEWIMRLAILNILFVFFSCVGLIIFGIAPAYTAMSAIFKRLYEGQEVSIIPSFYHVFKAEFFKSNKFGLLYSYFILLLFVNFLFIQTLPAQLQTVAMFIIILFAILLLMSFIYIFPLYLKFETTTWRLIKNSFYVSLAFLPRTLLTIFLIIGLLALCIYQPILIFIFGFSTLSAITLINSTDCLLKIQSS